MENTQINIGSNGTTTLATAGKYCDRNIDVNVAVPASGSTPTGTKNITSNGLHDVSAFANAQVDVPVGITPSGTKSIVSNGEYNISEYEKVNVNVPVPSGYIKPSGSINITENNKTVDVTSYASAVVAVPEPAQIAVVRTITISADVTGAGNTYTMLSGDAFIKEHYADAGFFAMWYMATPVASATNVLHWNFQGNRNYSSSSAARTGFHVRSTSASAVGVANNTTNINGKGYSAHMRVDSSGNLLQYLNSGYILKAGTYQIVLGCTT